MKNFYVTETSIDKMKVSEVKNLQTVPQNYVTCENEETYKKLKKYFNQLSIPFVSSIQNLTLIV